jgi:hypothetical protein
VIGLGLWVRFRHSVINFLAAKINLSGSGPIIGAGGVDSKNCSKSNFH